MRFYKNLKIYKYLIETLVIVVFSCLSCCSACLTSNVQLDYFSYCLNDYNSNTYYDDFHNPVMNVKKDETITYNDLIRYFYYNYMSGECREVVDQKIELILENGDTIGDVKLVGQDVFEVQEEIQEKMYKLDRNMYYCYYKNEIFDNRDYLTSRFNSSSFIFIDDTIADRMISKYNLSSYEDIIRNQEYSHVYAKIDGKMSELSFSINNIVYSSKRYAEGVKQYYGDFALCYFNASLLPDLTASFDVELKVAPFGNITAFEAIKDMGYNIDNSEFSFSLYNKGTGKYIVNEKLNKQFSNIYSSKTNTLGIILYIVSLLFGIVLIWFVSRPKNLSKRIMMFGLLTLIVITIASAIIVSFVYNNPLFSIAYYMFLIEFIILCRKEIFVLLKNKECSNVRFDERTLFYEIKI